MPAPCWGPELIQAVSLSDPNIKPITILDAVDRQARTMKTFTLRTLVKSIEDNHHITMDQRSAGAVVARLKGVQKIGKQDRKVDGVRHVDILWAATA